MRYLLLHLRDILVLPFSVVILIPWWITGGRVQPGTWVYVCCGLVFMTAGLALLASTIMLFYSFGRGTLAPWAETKSLVIRGPYRYSRNPMITGVWFILIGEALAVASVPLAAWAAVFFLINTIFFVLWEEPRMEARFGTDYQIYRRHVPRWVPRVRPFSFPG